MYRSTDNIYERCLFLEFKSISVTVIVLWKIKDHSDRVSKLQCKRKSFLVSFMAIFKYSLPILPFKLMKRNIINYTTHNSKQNLIALRYSNWNRTLVVLRLWFDLTMLNHEPSTYFPSHVRIYIVSRFPTSCNKNRIACRKACMAVTCSIQRSNGFRLPQSGI